MCRSCVRSPTNSTAGSRAIVTAWDARYVEEIEVLAPPDIEARFGLLGGNIFQGDMSPDQMFSLRPIPGYGDYRTPIEGLYLCGAGTHPGGGVMAVPGRNCARVVRGDHRRARLTLRR